MFCGREKVLTFYRRSLATLVIGNAHLDIVWGRRNIQQMTDLFHDTSVFRKVVVKGPISDACEIADVVAVRPLRPFVSPSRGISKQAQDALDVRIDHAIRDIMA